MQETATNIIFCSKCGQKNETISSFCTECGSKLGPRTTQQTNYVPKNESISYLNTNEMDLFLEKNQMYYNEKFERMSITGDKKSWNWAAFFLNAYWMLYRKMYLQAGGVTLISIMLANIPYVGGILSIAFTICIGIFANSLYFDHINKNLREIEQLYPNNKELMIRKKGGTNIVIPICIGGGLILIGIIFLLVIVSIMGIAYGGMFSALSEMFY